MVDQGTDLWVYQNIIRSHFINMFLFSFRPVLFCFPKVPRLLVGGLEEYDRNTYKETEKWCCCTHTLVCLSCKNKSVHTRCGLLPGGGKTLVHLSSVFSHSCLDLQACFFSQKETQSYSEWKGTLALWWDSCSPLYMAKVQRSFRPMNMLGNLGHWISLGSSG